MEKRYLLLLLNKSYFFKYVKDSNIKMIYKDKNKINIFLRKVASRIMPYLLIFFFNSWKNELNNYDKVIIFDNGYRNYISKFIKKKNPNIKIIYYYWNIINDKNKQDLNDKNVDEFWTFDENDAKVYKLKYFPQFYEKCFEPENIEFEYDVYFLGAAKDRKNDILEIQENLNKFNLKLNINIVYKKQKYSYDEYLEFIKKSKAILDVVGKSQSGLTLRTLEAQFYKKKLITNNFNIKNYPFYNSNNIFIYGIDDINRIGEFLDLPYENISNEIMYQYTYNNLIKTLTKE